MKTFDWQIVDEEVARVYTFPGGTFRVEGGVGLYIAPAGVPPFYLRIKDAAGFRAFMLSAVDAACDAWPEIAEDFELNHGEPVPE